MYIYDKKVINNKPHSEFTGYMVDESSTIKTFDYNSIYRSKQFNEAMKYFDTSDDMTRAVMLSVNEADQNVVMVSLANKLYKHITDKVDDIDFGTIPNSRGDITKIDNYEELVDCINIITEMLQQYHQSTDSIETITLALQNMIDRKDMFTKAYLLNVEMPIIIYNTMALSIVSSVSFMIASCIEFIKSADNNGFEISMNKIASAKIRDHLLFNDLKRFNKICANGNLDQSMDYIMKQNANNFVGGASIAFGLATSVVIIGLILSIIPIMRELIFFFYYARTKIADYFETQSILLTVNAYNIQNNLTRDDEEKKKIVEKQKKIADAFKKLSNFIKIKDKTSIAKTSNEINKLDKEKYKYNDVLDGIPDSSNSVLF